MSVHVSSAENAGAAEPPPPLRLLERPPARVAQATGSARPVSPDPAAAWGPGLLSWARRQLGWPPTRASEAGRPS